MAMQMLNLTHDWLRSFLPHVLTKIDRVSFGLLTPGDLKRALEVTPRCCCRSIGALCVQRLY